MSQKGHIVVKVVAVAVLLFILGFLAYKFLFSKYLSDLPNGINTKEDEAVTLSVEGDGVTKTVSQSGGRISVDEENKGGAIEVPEKAILGSQTINLIRINSISNLPEGSEFVNGVHIEASDITIVKPLKLTIPLETGADPTRLYGFAYDGEGSSFRLYPVNIKDGVAEFNIFHASGYGILAVTGPEFKPYTPSNARAKAEQDIALLLKGGWSGEKRGGLVEILQNWYHAGVKPKLAKSLGNSDLIMDAIQEYFSWMYMVHFFDVGGSLGSELQEANGFITKALVKAYEKASTLCIKEKDPGQISRLLKLAQIVQFFGREGVSGLNSEEMIQKARNCATFRLKVTSNFKWNQQGDGSCGLFEEDYSGEIPITVDETFNLTGTGKITLNRQSVCGSPCSIESGPDPYTETFSIVDTKLVRVKEKPEVTLALKYVDDTESRLYCPQYHEGSLIVETRQTAAWLPSFISEKLSMTDPDPTFYISDWEILGKGGVYARKVYDVEEPRDGEPQVEHTVFELIHDPK